MLCLGLAWLAPRAGHSAAPGGDGPDDARALAERILSRDGYQTELPGADVSGGTAQAGASAASRRSSASRDWRIPVPAGLGDLLEILVWIGAAALVVVLLVAGGRLALGAVRARRRPEAVGGAEEAAPAAHREGPGGPPPLSEADRLAAAGLYTEAAHALLVRALATLGARRGRAFPVSSTSREILASNSLAPGQRAPLEALVAPVERAVFGGVELGVDDWDRCRTAYRNLEVGA